MNRRDFLGTTLGATMASASTSGVLAGGSAGAETGAPQTDVGAHIASPRDVKVNLKPVMTNIIHTGTWEGPCRWAGVSVGAEKEHAEQRFAAWSKQLKDRGLGRDQDVNLLEPAHVTFSEDFVLTPEQLGKLQPDCRETDAYFVIPSGSSIAAYEIGKHFHKPIILKGLGCRNVDIAAYSRSMACEAFVPANDAELSTLISLLRARKVFTNTKVLFPTDRGLPAVCSVGSIWDLEGLKERLGIAVTLISYKELAEEMDRVAGSKPNAEQAEQAAEALLRSAHKSYIEKKYVVQSFLFHQAVKSLMKRHGSNAFTIECFEFCSSRLPERWTVTPCLIHSLLRNLGHASSCEADLGSLLAMRLLMSVAGKSCHQGNSDPRGPDTFRINHSVPSMKMNGYDKPDVPYELGRFVQSGWGTKVVVDFMDNAEKTVTVARVNPPATKLLVLKGQLVGASGWGQDALGCSVEALIKPPDGKADLFLKKRLEYGNHLQWVYGDYTAEMQQLGEMLNLEVEVVA